MSFVIIYSSAVKLLSEITSLTQLDPSLQNNFILNAKLQELAQMLDQMKECVRRETSSIKKQSQKEKLESLQKDYSFGLERLNALKQEIQSRTNEANRNELLGQTITNRNTSTILNLDDFDTNHSSRLDGASAQVDDYINLGRQSLQELYSQRDLLKSTQRKILDAANKLGLSSSVIKFIEQRSLTDKYILYGGLAVCLVIMYLIIVYLG